MSHDGTINHDQSEPKTFILGINIVFLIIILIITFIVFGMFFNSLKNIEQNKKQNIGPNKELTKLKNYENKELSTLKWLDKKKGKVQIPIDLAIKNVAKTYQK
ncbi:hypothetical protein DID75_04105 [Candidatus Marinamargulisbacteria bacterium SCGC AG-410-N11]|nr:hypothetical protein DID75_04105 [Candidatus Marinamargulisbacteria bacterium SCGC AG-410-N11]